jgi:hypothetical protein
MGTEEAAGDFADADERVVVPCAELVGAKGEYFSGDALGGGQVTGGRSASSLSRSYPPAQSLRVITSGDQQLPGIIDANARQRDQARGSRCHQRREQRVQLVDLG